VIFPLELPLDHNCCGFASSFGVGASSMAAKKFVTINNTQVWALPRKQQDYWKPKGRSSLAWAFFVATTSSSREARSSENETNQPK
jgi:hypothetical protein